MENLLEAWPQIREGLRGKHIFLSLDYDGTLTPIMEFPSEAHLPEENRRLLEMLSVKEGLELSIITGRSLKDIRSLVGIANIEYVGNHGFEIEGAALNFESLVPSGFKAVLEDVKRKLSAALMAFAGSFIEDKGLTFSVHYRMVNPIYVPELKKVFDDVCAKYLQSNQIRLHQGKKVLEVLPPIDWNKGEALRWLLKKSGKPSKVIYIGDDLTDEDAFKAVGPSGMAVRVGGAAPLSHATYYLEGTAEVSQFLKYILTL